MQDKLAYLAKEQFQPTISCWMVSGGSTVVIWGIVFKAAISVSLPKAILSQMYSGSDLVTVETARASSSI